MLPLEAVFAPCATLVFLWIGKIDRFLSGIWVEQNAK